MDSKITDNETGLSRRLGLFASTLVGVGIILGAGIYVLVGVAAGQAGNAVWLSFIIAALVATFTGLSYVRLSRLRPKDAPEFQFLNMAFGQTPAFMAGWTMLWATGISAPAVALGFGGYLEHITGIPLLVGAIGLIILSSLIIFIGVGESAILAGIFTLVEVGGIVFIIIIGIPSFGQANLFEMPGGISGVIGAAALVFFAFLGFESMANLSEEMKNPERDLPKAILLAIGISTALYVLVAISAVSVLGWEELSRSSAPLATVASSLLGTEANLVLALVALASTANTVLLLLFAASRAMWAMSCAGALPMTFCVIGKNRRTPWITIIIVGTIASVACLVQKIEQVAEFTNFATLLAFAGVNASAIRIFMKNKHNNRLKHIFMDIILPVAGIIASLWLAVNTGWIAMLFGGIILVCGIALHFILRLFRKRRSGHAGRV